MLESICGDLVFEWLALPEKKASRILTSRSCDLQNEEQREKNTSGGLYIQERFY